MKKSLLILFAFTAISMGFLSCEKDKDEEKPVPKEIIEFKETISAKWEVNPVKNNYLNTYEFVSFEFTEEGIYIIVTLDSVWSNTYDIVDTSTIVLDDFGSLVNISISGNTLSFTVQYNGNNVPLDADKTTEIESTMKTNLLCRSWYLYSVDGETDLTKTEFSDIDDPIDEATVLFSDAGTYYVEHKYKGNIIYAGMAKWKWKDNTEVAFCYTWDDDFSYCNEEYVVINELTETTLDITEYYYDGYDTYTTEYILKPLVNTKQAILSTPKKLKNNKGFLKTRN